MQKLHDRGRLAPEPARRDDYGRDPRTDCVGAEDCKKLAHTVYNDRSGATVPGHIRCYWVVAVCTARARD